jgi:hypothetical protein
LSSGSRSTSGRWLGLILIIALCGVGLRQHGWRASLPTMDLVPHYWDAGALVTRGIIPRRGTLNSYQSYNPPGPTWLVAPALLVTHDPRLFDIIGTSLLYAGTLIGIFCVAEPAFGTSAAVLATIIFAFSNPGLFFAWSLWPRGHPFFFIWMVYWARRWAVERQPNALGMALFVWAAGMYVFMEIAPAILLLPVCWYIYRPPVRTLPLAIASAAVLVLWLPYLQFEGTRGYRDVAAVLAQEPVQRPVAQAGSSTWCDASLPLVAVVGRAPMSAQATSDAAAPGSLKAQIAGAGYTEARKLRGGVGNAVSSFTGGGTTRLAEWAGIVLLAVTLFSTAAVGVNATPLGAWSTSAPTRRRRVPTLAAAAALITAGGLAGPLLRAIFSTHRSLEPETEQALLTVQVILVAAGLLVVLFTPAVAALASRWRSESPDGGRRREARAFLVTALLVPWIALMLITEPGRGERFWWLWPLQAIFLAVLASCVLPAYGVRRSVRAIVAAVTVALACGAANPDFWNGLVSSPLPPDSDYFRAIEYIASRVGPQHEASIGYHLAFFEGIPRLHQTDARFKVGGELDVIFAYRFHLTNTSRCPEGIAPDDQFRIAEDASAPPRLGRFRFDVQPGPEFEPTRRFGHIQVFERR